MTESEKYKLIADCNTFEELKECFDKIGNVKGTKKEYTPQRLKEKVDQLILLVAQTEFTKFVPFNNLTRTYGIRAKVIELLWYHSRNI